MQVNMFTTGVPVDAIDPEIIRTSYNKLKKRKRLVLPPKKNITVTTEFDGNFTLATLFYRGRGPVSHRYEVMVTTGVAKRNPNDMPNTLTGIALATYRAMRQLGILLKEKRTSGVAWHT